jgi:putative membrane protein
MAVVMVGFWVLVAYGIVWLVRLSSGRTQPPEARSDARAVLDRRFASGEIDEQEYRSRLDVLTGAARDYERSP